MFKNRSIQWKIMSFIPMALVALILLSFFSYSFSKAELETQISEKMGHINAEVINDIDAQFLAHQRIGESIAAMVEARGNALTAEDYTETLKRSVELNEDTFGTGVWFEPYTFAEDVEYFGPYAYEEDGEVLLTDEYETSDYDFPSHDWYQVGEESSDVAWTEPYYDETLDITMVTTSIPFKDENGQFGGVVTADIDITNIQHLISDIETVDQGWAFMVGEDGEFISHPDGEKVMQKNIAEDHQLSEWSEDLLHNEYGTIVASLDDGDAEVFYQEVPRTGWTIGLVVPEDEAYAPLNGLLSQIIVVSGGIVALLVVIGILLSRRLIRPIVKLNEEVNKVADGDLSVRIVNESNDEIGQLTKNFNDMTENMRQLIEAVQRSVNTVSQSSENLSAVVDETTASSEEVSRAVDEIADGASHSASYAEETNQQTVTLSEQIERLLEQANRINGNAREAKVQNQHGIEQIELLRNHSTHADSVIASVQQVIQGLSHKVKEIESIITTITGISEQTNLLALNASIEAARAGEHGKGFAVVADEVRKLAEETSRATDHVKETLKGIEAESEQAVREMKITSEISGEQNQVVEDTESVFKTIFNTIDGITVAMTDMTDRISEMNEYKEKVVGAIQNISSVAQESSAASEEVSASTEEQTKAMQSITTSAEELKESSEQLASMMNRFKT
ncbi:methyl-accepting chemotaxis protein [Texcoconibacillus texcoconensis]|uniref:Methyl-accepting chemotaxis protein n=1 Tax=Texcoconibacillus texcoconensis TaxID=1095777 RepID=A0A840QLW2_9BACI|nr:methyl-accepting chemotaxis protein [Texcoconibacillus texcoconensis]MBB5172357.1 methyl-accepting chemotaxis protein [Texcoconibacillus texcoconensis]